MWAVVSGEVEVIWAVRVGGMERDRQDQNNRSGSCGSRGPCCVPADVLSALRISSLNPYNHPVRWALSLSPFYRWGNSGMGGLERGRARIGT